MNKNSKILVCGGSGLVGSAIIRELKKYGYTNIISARLHGSDNVPEKIYQIDFRSEDETNLFIYKIKPEYVFIAAAKVGGVLANSKYPVEFLTDNMRIELNIIINSYQNEAKKVLFLGSSCIYPKNCAQPIREEDILSGPLESTNEAYALAKIAGIKLIEYYCKQYGKDGVCLMPCNLYGPNDNFDPQGSHVIPGMINKFHKAKINNESEVILWGTGKPQREFLYSSDLAKAAIIMMYHHSYQNTKEILYNVGSGEEYSIRGLAGVVSSVIGYCGNIKWDNFNPDGVSQKLMSNEKFEKFLYDKNLSWKPNNDMYSLLGKVYKSYLEGIKYP